MARTARQRAALRKAQIASARKRRGKGKGKLAKSNRRNRRLKRVAIGSAVVAGASVGLAGYALSGIASSNSSKTRRKYYGDRIKKKRKLVKRGRAIQKAGRKKKHKYESFPVSDFKGAFRQYGK